MRRELIFAVVGLGIGLGIGFFGANSLNRDGVISTSGSSNTAASNSVPSEVTAQTVDEVLSKATAEPQNFSAQMKTGDLYAQISRLDKAIEFYKRGLILQPENFDANVVLANTLFDAGQFEEAEAYYSKALSIDKKNVNARVDLGATFVERSNPNYDRAIEEFDQALALDPKSEPANYYLGIARLRQGDRDGALRQLAELEKLNPTSPLIGRLRQNIDPPR
jgi:tetratricopeptide (TPR) repeat protein